MYQAREIMALMAKSAGTTWATFSSSHWTFLNIPFPPESTTTEGPFRFSTQLGVGSRSVDMTR